MKAKRLIAAALACSLSIPFTACENKASDGSSEAKAKSGESEWWDVNREDMEEEITENSEPSTEETTEEETEEETTEAETVSATEEATVESATSVNKLGSSGSSTETSEKETESYSDPYSPDMVYYPDVVIFGDKNMGDEISICTVTINGVKLSAEEETVDSLISKAGIVQNVNYTCANEYEEENTNDGIFWYGKGYGIEDETGQFNGTHVFIEGLDNDIFIAASVDPSVKDGYRIRSIYSSIDTTMDDFTINYIGGIRVGMTREDIENALGAGSTSLEFTYYANQHGALVINYDEDETAMEIYLFVDYEDVPIEYCPLEEETEEETTDSEEVSESTTYEVRSSS